MRTALPAEAGVGYKPQHFEALLAAPNKPGFLEIHAENYMTEGGWPHRQLGALRRDHALSIHGVGLSLGGTAPLDRNHLARVKTLCDRYEPESFSEHLAWTAEAGICFNDLLPLPYTQERLTRVIEHIDAAQEFLGRRILIENPATYIAFATSAIPETEFLAELVRRTGCGLLLDVNNVHVCAQNHGFDARAYLTQFPFEAVGEIHLAGHDVAKDSAGGRFLVDSHAAPVADDVFALYAEVLAKTGPLPTLIERDDNVPQWARLEAEMQVAADLIAAVRSHSPEKPVRAA